MTVNRAFSRRFFEALDGQPEVAQQALHDLDVSAPLEMLDETDLISDDVDLEAELDESDLIHLIRCVAWPIMFRSLVRA